MEDKLKKILQDKMEGFSPTEIAPQFSSSHTWEQLSGRLEAQTRRRVLPVIWLYAAALLAGVIIGGFSIHYIDNGARREPFTAGITKPQPPVFHAPAAATPASLTAKSSEPVLSKRDYSRRLKFPPHPTHKDDKQDAVITQFANIKPRIDSLPAMPKTMATNVAKNPPILRAVHLLDVESEDRTLLTDRPAVMHSGTSFSIYISPTRLPDGKDDQTPSSVLRPFFR